MHSKSLRNRQLIFVDRLESMQSAGSPIFTLDNFKIRPSGMNGLYYKIITTSDIKKKLKVLIMFWKTKPSISDSEEEFHIW